MGVWVVRTKSDGRALDLGIIPVGWDLDLTPATTRDGIEQLYREKWPQARDTIIGGRVDQLWDFRFEMKVDDLIIMPRRTGSVAIGRVTGPFRYRPDLHGPMRMTHQVEWLDTDLPASALGEDIRRSLLTFERFDVYPIRRSGIDALILAALGGQKGCHMPPVDVETYAGIGIQNAIGQIFPGTDLIRLAAGILRAQGLQAHELAPAESHASLLGTRPG